MFSASSIPPTDRSFVSPTSSALSCLSPFTSPARSLACPPSVDGCLLLATGQALGFFRHGRKASLRSSPPTGCRAKQQAPAPTWLRRPASSNLRSRFRGGRVCKIKREGWCAWQASLMRASARESYIESKCRWPIASALTRSHAHAHACERMAALRDAGRTRHSSAQLGAHMERASECLCVCASRSL
jgi:hypothetical protein